MAQDVSDAASLVAHCRGPKVGAIVLISANGGHGEGINGEGISFLKKAELNTGLKLIEFVRF